jgi:hypothetical protein
MISVLPVDFGTARTPGLSREPLLNVVDEEKWY